MKKSIIMAAFALFSMAACTVNVNDKKQQENHSENSHKEGKEHTSAYICPMHCEGSGSDSAGTCPVCKMDYIKNDKK